MDVPNVLDSQLFDLAHLQLEGTFKKRQEQL